MLVLETDSIDASSNTTEVLATCRQSRTRVLEEMLRVFRSRTHSQEIGAKTTVYEDL